MTSTLLFLVSPMEEEFVSYKDLKFMGKDEVHADASL